MENARRMGYRVTMENKIKKVHNILMKRLPKSYRIPIRIFKNTEELLRSCVEKHKKNYEEIVKHYNMYLSFCETASYVKTKYFPYRPKRAFDISALSGNPIYVSSGRLKELGAKDYEIAFLLLHEIGHNVLALIYSLNEKKCDIFASKWIRKLIKEKIIKGGD